MCLLLWLRRHWGRGDWLAFLGAGMVGRNEYLQHEVGVYEIVEGLQEDSQEAESGQETRESWYNPVNVSSVTRPAEPK